MPSAVRWLKSSAARRILNLTMVLFSHVTVHQLAVYIITIGIVVGCDILIHRDQGTAAHVRIIP